MVYGRLTNSKCCRLASNLRHSHWFLLPGSGRVDHGGQCASPEQTLAWAPCSCVIFPFLIEGQQHVHKLTFHICSENDPRREDNVSKKIASGFAIRLPQLILIRKPLLCRPISQLPFIYFFLKSTGVNKCNYYFPLIEKNSRCYCLPDSTYPYLDLNHLFNLLM
jgi:hypothetical protein